MSSAIFTGFASSFTSRTASTPESPAIPTAAFTRATAWKRSRSGTADKGTLEPGKYILLRYLDPPWQGFYDIFKIINDDLLIGRVYLGEYPNGARVFTFPMSRRYGFDQMTVDDHAALFAAGAAPHRGELDGVWRMDIDLERQPGRRHRVPAVQQQAGRALRGALPADGPDGRPGAADASCKDHFQLNDFTPFHDEIRKVSDDFLVGKYMTALPPALASLLGNSVARAVPRRDRRQVRLLLHADAAPRQELADEYAARARSSTRNCRTASA